MTELMVLQNCRTIQLSQGRNTLVDANDWIEFGKLKWSVDIREDTSYVVKTIRLPKVGGKRRNRLLKLHRSIMGDPLGFHVDHRNGDGLDNRRENLRLSTRTQNQQNQRRACGSSRFKGVVWASVSWMARIGIGPGKHKYLGRFKIESDAAHAYDAAARELYGEFACTNEDLFGQY